MAAAAAPIRSDDDASEKKQFAITMDDPKTTASPRLTAPERNLAILEALEKAGTRAALFVCGMRVDDEPGRGVLDAWSARGHILANHTYSHLYLHAEDLSAADFVRDIERGERVIQDYDGFRYLFRYPLLKEGDSVEKRDTVRGFLAEQGYRVGHATVDASDWYIEGRMIARLENEPRADLARYRDFYLEHMWERARYYDDLALAVVKRAIPHTILIHHNLLNALFLGDLIAMFEAKGWKLVDAAAAFEDEVFRAQPDIVPAGESIVWALAKESGAFEDRLRYPGEDGVYEKAAMDRLGL